MKEHDILFIIGVIFLGMGIVALEGIAGAWAVLITGASVIITAVFLKEKDVSSKTDSNDEMTHGKDDTFGQWYTRCLVGFLFLWCALGFAYGFVLGKSW